MSHIVQYVSNLNYYKKKICDIKNVANCSTNCGFRPNFVRLVKKHKPKIKKVKENLKTHYQPVFSFD